MAVEVNETLRQNLVVLNALRLNICTEKNCETPKHLKIPKFFIASTKTSCSVSKTLWNAYIKNDVDMMMSMWLIQIGNILLHVYS